MYKPTEEPSYKQDNACDPANDPQATIGGNGYNRDGESESAATASAQPDKLLNIPQEMRERPQWCLAATDKRPLQLNKANADPTNPATWSTFDAVYAKAKEYGLGVGYVLTKDDPYTCIDLDIKDTTPAEHIKLIHKIRSDFQSYTESSQSGRGYHVWVKGSVPKGRKRDSVEVYSSERFIVCTGDIVNELPIKNRQGLLSSMYLQMSPEEADVELPPDQPVVGRQ